MRTDPRRRRSRNARRACLIGLTALFLISASVAAQWDGRWQRGELHWLGPIDDRGCHAIEYQTEILQLGVFGQPGDLIGGHTIFYRYEFTSVEDPSCEVEGANNPLGGSRLLGATVDASQGFDGVLDLRVAVENCEGDWCSEINMDDQVEARATRSGELLIYESATAGTKRFLSEGAHERQVESIQQFTRQVMASLDTRDCGRLLSLATATVRSRLDEQTRQSGQCLAFWPDFDRISTDWIPLEAWSEERQTWITAGLAVSLVIGDLGPSVEHLFLLADEGSWKLEGFSVR